MEITDDMVRRAFDASVHVTYPDLARDYGAKFKPSEVGLKGMRAALEAALGEKANPTIQDRMVEEAERIVGGPVKVDVTPDGQHFILSSDVGPYWINFGCVHGIQSCQDILRDVRVVCNSAKLTGNIKPL